MPGYIFKLDALHVWITHHVKVPMHMMK